MVQATLRCSSSRAPASDANLLLSVVSTVEALREFRTEWERLARDAEDCPLCLSYVYCELAAAIALGRGADVVLARAYQDGMLTALWPLAIYRKGLVRIARDLTCGNDEEYGGPLVKSREWISVALRAAQLAPADILEIRWIEAGSPLLEALATASQPWLLGHLPARIGRLPTYSVRLQAFPTWESFESTLSRKLRQNLRRGFKGLSAFGQVQTGWCATSEETEHIIDWLFANKRRWAEKRDLRRCYLMEDEVRDFFVALAREVDLAAKPLAACIKVDGVPVAAGIAGVDRKKLEFLVTTYDETFARYSVGVLLYEFLARWAQAHQLELDFRYLCNPFKEACANHVTTCKTHFVVLSAKGRLMEIPLATRAVVKPLARRLSGVAKTLRRSCVTIAQKTVARLGDVSISRVSGGH